MKLKTGVFIGGAIAGLAMLVWAKTSSSVNAVKNLSITPMWYGGVNDMKVSLSGVKLPLAIDIENRSDQTITARINAVDIYQGESKIAYNKASLTEFTLSPYSTERVKLDVVVSLSFIYNLCNLSATQILSGKGFDQILEAFSDMKFRIDFTVNNTIQTPILVDMEGGTVTLDGVNRLCGLSGCVGLVVKKGARGTGNISKYQHLIPEQSMLSYSDPCVIRGVTPEQTARMIRRLAKKTAWQTAELAKALEGGDIETTTENIFNFVYKYIDYQKDSSIREELRLPLRSLYDQRGDCDCMALLIASIMENLKYNYKIRIAAYDSEGTYQHVYIVVDDRGIERICDPVLEECFTQKEYTRKKDF